MKECKIDNVNKIFEENKSSIPSYDFTKRRLTKGQWVDVKDTIDQWLEAQVIDVKDDKVYIHYNGWGTRWDEWIDLNSNRIRPFRYHTSQTNINNYHSPYPNGRPDADVNLQSNYQTDFYDLFDDLKRNLNSANNMMEEISNSRKSLNKNNVQDYNEREGFFSYNNNISSGQINANNITMMNNHNNKHKTQKEVYYMTKNLVPMFDRLGRIMTDMGTYMNFNLKNNKLEDLDKKVFTNDDIDAELKNVFEIIPGEEAERGRNANSDENPRAANKFDRLITHQIPCCETPLSVYNHRHPQGTQPLVDVYIHTFITPISGQTGTESTGTLNAQPGASLGSLRNLFNTIRNNPMTPVNTANNSTTHTNNNTNINTPINNIPQSEPNSNSSNNRSDDIEIIEETAKNKSLGRKRENNEDLEPNGNKKQKTGESEVVDTNTDNMNFGNNGDDNNNLSNAPRHDSLSSYEMVIEELLENPEDEEDGDYSNTESDQ